MPKYNVIISQNWSEEVKVTAKNYSEAKKKAWDKWKAKKMNYNIQAEKLNQFNR